MKKFPAGKNPKNSSTYFQSVKKPKQPRDRCCKLQFLFTKISKIAKEHVEPLEVGLKTCGIGNTADSSRKV